MTAVVGATTVRVEIADGVGTITLDRAPLNVLTMAMLGELETALRDLQREPELRLIVIKGAGRAFSAGVDVGEHLGASLRPMLEAFDRAAKALLDSEVPTLAVVHGAALGGGCELVALCDLAIAADDAKLGTPEIALGVVPPVGAAVFPSLIGLQRTNALVLTGEAISGADAASWGLVWRSVPADRLEEETRTVVEKFRSRSAASLRFAKRTLRVSERGRLANAITVANNLQIRELPELADAEEGLRSFVEKRPPRWRHR